MAIKQYRVFCDTDEKYVTGWSEDEPTTCFENGAHAIDSTKTSVMATVDDDFPRSTIDGVKLAVHTSYKPEVDGIQTYAIWSGAGDDMADSVHGNGNGPLIQIHSEVGVTTKSVDIEFDAAYGQVWLHEAYIKFTDGGIGDYVSASVYTHPVPLQTVANLDLIVTDTFIKYSASGPGTGTHGFADATKITLVPRHFSGDGDWDWDYDSNSPVPNFAGTGDYRMSTVEQLTHRIVNKVPCYGTCGSYVSLSSDETMKIWAGYFCRFTAHNESNSVWHISGIMELYREVTHS